jgi:5-methyltetrahydropteroyltriglutamate--homocysteine methyltransferase
MKAPFRADQVGSLLRPAEVKEARARLARGEIGRSALVETENRAIERIIARQESIGLRGVTDGELRRDNWMFDFLSGLGGTRVTERDATAVPRGGDSKTAAPQRMKVTTVAGKVRFDGHPMLEHFRFLRAHTRATAKMTIPSPTMLVTASRDWREVVERSAYSDLEALHADLGAAYKQAIRAFYDAGCRYLQLDDVNLAYFCDAGMRDKMKARGDDPDTMLRKCVGMLRSALEGRPSDMTITTHICRGNFRSTWFAQGGYEAVAEAVFGELDYDGYFLEYDTERAGGFEPLRHVPKGRKRVVLGLVTTKSGALEDKDAIKRRVDAAGRYVDLEQLCLSPQCGFASTEHGNLLTEEEQWSKLGEVVELAREIWKDA